MAGDFLGTGWAFPIKPVPARGIPLAGGAEKVRQSIWLILSTAPGERPMRPDFGCGIHDLVFMANTVALRGLVQAKVREALVKWEPRIDVVDVTVESPAELGNQLLIRIDYAIRSNNTFFNLVFPFYLNEGVGLS
jgi:phage baseplate assembly protein W